MLDENQKMNKRNEKINNYLNVLEVLSQSTDDFLFLLDIKNGVNWFFGDLEKKYNLVKKDERVNTIEEMMGIIYPADREKNGPRLYRLYHHREGLCHCPLAEMGRRRLPAGCGGRAAQ